MIMLFFVLALLACLQMVIYRGFNGLDTYKNIDQVANWSFGSLGYPTSVCAKNIINWESDKI